jgi:hypothetical protein
MSLPVFTETATRNETATNKGVRGDMFDVEPATRTLAMVVTAVRDDQLSARTPCSEATVGDLIDHVDGLSIAFTAAANKTKLPLESQIQEPMAHDWGRTGGPGPPRASLVWPRPGGKKPPGRG